MLVMKAGRMCMLVAAPPWQPAGTFCSPSEKSQTAGRRQESNAIISIARRLIIPCVQNEESAPPMYKSPTESHGDRRLNNLPARLLLIYLLGQRFRSTVFFMGFSIRLSA